VAIFSLSEKITDELIREDDYEHKAAAPTLAKQCMRPIFFTSAVADIGVTSMIIGKYSMWAALGAVLVKSSSFNPLLVANRKQLL